VTGRDYNRNQHECQGHLDCAGKTGIERRWGSETWRVESRETTTGATSRLDLVVGINGQKIKELGVECRTNGRGIFDLVLAITTQEGTTKRGDGGLDKLKEPAWSTMTLSKALRLRQKMLSA